MTVPIIICDDSSFARKQVARVLPSNWDVSITYAANGREAIEALHAGLGDVLFLDLTMPDMDGFAVLEHIRNHDLPTLPIVISGDIQAASQQRVKQLGGMAFLKKPVDGVTLASVLNDYGLLQQQATHAEQETEAVGFYDWCQEIANVAMGRAASLLAGVIFEGVELSIPRVNLLENAELQMLLGAVGQNQVSAVSQGFIGTGIAGETLVFFDDASLPTLAKLMDYPEDELDTTRIELLMEMGNLLVGAFLKGLAEQLNSKFSMGHPRICLHNSREQLARSSLPQLTLTIELSYRIGQTGTHCDQLLLFTESSITTLQQHMERTR